MEGEEDEEGVKYEDHSGDNLIEGDEISLRDSTIIDMSQSIIDPGEESEGEEEKPRVLSQSNSMQDLHNKIPKNPQHRMPNSRPLKPLTIEIPSDDSDLEEELV